MKCPKCKKISRCGCNSCKSRVKFPKERAYKISNHPLHKDVGIITCPYCRSSYSEEFLMALDEEFFMGLDLDYPLFKVGDTIEWSFADDDTTIFKGKTFQAQIAMIDKGMKCYAVYCEEYGVDMIPFNQCKLIKSK